MAVYAQNNDHAQRSAERVMDRVRNLERIVNDDKARIAELKVRMKDLEALFSELAEAQNEMAACQPKDPKGDLARAEARFDEHKKLDERSDSDSEGFEECGGDDGSLRPSDFQ